MELLYILKIERLGQLELTQHSPSITCYSYSRGLGGEGTCKPFKEEREQTMSGNKTLAVMCARTEEGRRQPGGSGVGSVPLGVPVKM